MHKSRRNLAKQVRVEAAELAENRTPVHHCNNKEEYEYRDVSKDGTPVTHLANFTKGLPHCPKTGLLLNPTDYKLFVTGIQSGDPVDFRNTPLGPGELSAGGGAVPSTELITSEVADRSDIWKSEFAKDENATVRAWESAGAGNVLDLEGPDAQAVTMPPAPRFDSDELLAEIAEVYSMAILRDAPFNSFPLPEQDVVNGRGATTEFQSAATMLSELPWFQWDASELNVNPAETARRRDLEPDGANLFRGVSPGEQIGPYLSQFLLLGNDAIGGGRVPSDGFIQYGAIGIQQKVRIATPGKDYLTVWAPYVDVQNGADLRGKETYESPAAGSDQGHRFIATPRDLATYVHHDALYEAYLNACLFLLASKAPFDRGIPFLETDTFDKQQGFAHFGGPHILTLVCEVATRALKAVRFQKFNVHRRLRPEALGGRIDAWINKRGGTATRKGALRPLRWLMKGDNHSGGFESLEWSPDKSFVERIKEHNAANNSQLPHSNEPKCKKASYLLPMAFAEGSPMHPAYGAGHATVAGACVTILKAYFDHGWTPPAFLRKDASGDITPIAYEPNADGNALVPIDLNQPLTIEGELNKLAGNIAIGRNWAGVHYYTDYIESLRMGEQIAIGMLEEQKLTYPENFTMTVPLFDGHAVRI